MNELFPIFIKPDKLRLLIVGGGFVGLEKISAFLNNSPRALIDMVAPEIRPEIVELAQKHPGVSLHYKPFDESDLENKDIVIAGTAIKELNARVWQLAKAKKIIVNVADTPDLCDFYMSSVVCKGDLKIGISTNGKSPTLAKRMREMLEEILPDSMQSVLDNLKTIRDRLKGDFEFKVNKLNEITSVMRDENTENQNQ